MMAYEKLDAWKGCHALVLAVHKFTDNKIDQDPRLIMRLRYIALRAAGKLAFGSGTRNRRMFQRAAERSAGYLSEFAYHLAFARVMGLLSEENCKRLDALRGRAAFYTFQLLEGLMEARGN